MLENIKFNKYFGDRLIGQHSEGFYVIIPNDACDPRPIFCSHCDCVLSTIEDQNEHEKLGCCQHCKQQYYYQNKEAWDNGWRPEKKKDCNHLKTIIISE